MATVTPQLWRAADGREYATVPAGPFVYGPEETYERLEQAPPPRPRQTLELDAFHVAVLPVTYADWKAFTYWLFKFRLKRQDKARVASDTRKGLAQLTLMEMQVSSRRKGAHLDEAGFAERYGNESPARERRAPVLAGEA